MRDAHSVEQASSPQQQGLPDHVPQDAENQPPDNADGAREEEERNASVDPDTQYHPPCRADPFDEGSSPPRERPLMTMDDLDHNPSNATRDGHKRDDAAPKKARTERASSSSSHLTSEESSENEYTLHEYTLPKGSGRARTAARNPAGADSEDEPPAAQAASTSAAVGLGDNRPTAVPNLLST
ncbi:hypothetical protein OH76DRAFT_1424005 [Lentinus brumalis]|uniref:Uncharacterized protein n=1 Tax=Lentinus brumalis TaxID=2498619 RepID=A0A371CI44_9APHY|nr:hypothetical protein OH76DRAFT_1424005 [Polyporus brumalis]